MNRIINFYALFLNLLGACFALPLATALIYGETTSVRAFAIVMAGCIALGTVMHFACRSDINAMELRPRDSYFLVASVWLIASVIGCIPYMLTGCIPSFFEALFETCSGFTTTGATIVSDVEAMPRAILMWRSFTQWLGGMGIIVLFVALLPRFGIKARNIAKAETPGPTVTKLTSRFTGTAQRLYIVYIVLTMLLVLFLMGGGLDFFDALNHSFTTMATGGFSTYNDSVGHFHNNYISWIITLFMFLAGTNFELFFIVLNGNIKRALKNEEFRLYVIILAVSTGAIAASLLANGGYDSIYQAVTDSAFQVTTVMTTTGYATTNFGIWPTFCQMVLFILMVIGASSSSTAGGIKVIRVLVLFKMIKREIGIKLHGNIVRDVSLDSQKVLSETVTYIIGFVTMYFITLILATFLISIPGNGNLVTNLTATLSCISNVGPGLDSVGPVFTYHFYDGFSKFVLSMVMIAGRLELSTFFIIFSRFFWDPHRV
ncbi:MAG: TrkH family potassium uptake protein [Mogibacterium sp.]|nr:TrkH family potassium uptake protein [Mogibacterium sp.]